MVVRRDVLSRFLLLYCALYGGFGIASPFLPPFLAARGLQPEELGILLGAGTAVRLISAPLAGRLADVFHAFRAELALFAVVAAIASLLYLTAHAFWTVVLVSLFHAAMLAPLVPLTDALALSAARPYEHRSAGAFEYGWVRGAGSAAFVAGALLSGQAVGLYGLGSILWLSAVCLFATALSAPLVPELVTGTPMRANKQKVLGRDWVRLLHQPAFVRVTWLPLSFSAATPCMIHLLCSAGATPASSLQPPACFGRNRLPPKSWCSFALVPISCDCSVGRVRWRWPRQLA
jgi:MFS family permease